MTTAAKRCAACGSAATAAAVTAPTGATFRRCGACGHHTRSSPPVGEGRAAPARRARSQGATDADASDLRERLLDDYQQGIDYLRRYVLAYARVSSLLDVAAGTGGVVRAARDAGLHAEGVEPAPELRELARQAHGIELHDREVDLAGALGALGGPFQAVTVRGLLECSPDPVGLLGECRRVAAAIGVLAVTTLTTDSRRCHLEGGDWGPYQAREHVNLCSGASLATMVTRAGFTVVDLYCTDEDHCVAIAEPA